MIDNEREVLRKIIATGEVSLESRMEESEQKLIPALVSLGYLEERDREVQAGVQHGGKRIGGTVQKRNENPHP